MKKILLSLISLLAVTSLFAESFTTSPSSLTTDDVVGTITITYDATGSSLNTSGNLDLYMWINSKNSGWDTKTYIMTKGTGNIYTYTLSLKTTLGLTDDEVLASSSVGFIVRDNSGGQTGNFMFSITPSQQGSDRFKFDFGPKAGGEGWDSIELFDSGDGDKYTADITIPEDFTNYRGWVGYNSGGIGAPGWVNGRSADINFDDITGIAAGEMTVVISKNSISSNWGIYLITRSTTGIDDADNSEKTVCYGTNNSIVAKFNDKSDVSVYLMNGVLLKKVHATNSINIDVSKGLYIVKINSEIFKVIVR